MKKFLLGSLFLISSTLSSGAFAEVITFVGSGTSPGQNGVPVSASAIFDINGNNLTVTLQNTSPSNTHRDVPGSTLTGLFWNFTGSPTLTPISATVVAGSIMGDVCAPTSCTGVTNVGGEFGYQAASFTGGADRGIASSGYLQTGLPNNIGNFNNGLAGTNLDDPRSLDGINFGIISSASGYNPNNGLAAVPVIQDSVVFRLTGVNGLTIADISNVSFQYGTNITELNVPGEGAIPPASVPEPTTVALLGLGLLGFAASRRNSAKSKNA